jgi:U3 small nucleolar RNA-associated protein 25
MSREQDDDSESESPSEDEEELDEDESSDEEDDEPLPTVSAYEVLMQSFASERPREAKRRKIEHVQEPEVVESKDDDSEDGSVDEVEEAEEGPETATDGLLDDDDDLEDTSDSFETHFANPDDNLLSKTLKAIQQSEWTTHKLALPKTGHAVIATPEVGGGKITALPTISGPEDLKLKQKLAGAMSRVRPAFDVLEKTIAPVIFNYKDILFCERDLSNQEDLRRLTCLHAVNHVFKRVPGSLIGSSQLIDFQDSKSRYQKQCTSCKR